MEEVATNRVVSHGEDEFHTPATTPTAPQHGDRTEASEESYLDAPVHPVRSMQLAFEESIIESTEEPDANPASDGNAEVRRQLLLESKDYEQSWQARWKQRPKAKYHPLLKLVSQIVFGLHLLQQQQAKSEGEVVKILQSHVNEVDSFLERTADDFKLAINDINERIRHLKLPMEHKEVFKVMLDDKSFRTQLLDGNDKIESIIDRTTRAMEASLYDLQEGNVANKELGRYLDSVRDSWPREKRVISDVFSAMRGNELGWSRYILDLQSKASSLRHGLAKLGSLLGQMSQLAAEASRRNASQSRVVHSGSKSAPRSPGLRSEFPTDPAPPMPSSNSQGAKAIKPVQKDSSAAAKGATTMHNAPALDLPSRARASSKPSDGDIFKRTKSNEAELQRPRTAGAATGRQPRDADARGDTSDLAAFLKQDFSKKDNVRPGAPHFNPLRSNPPEADYTSRMPSHDRKSSAIRSKSIGAVETTQKGHVPRDSSTSTMTSIDPADRAQTLSGTGFARRLSKRMKHLPTEDEIAAEDKAKQGDQYPDSAYASGPESKSTPPTPSQKPQRLTDSLGPLPKKGMEPLYASKITELSKVNKENWKDGTNQSVRSLAPTSKSKGSTIKGAFQRKWSSGKKLFGGQAQ